MIPSSGTDMYDCWAAIKRGNRTHVRLEFTNQNITIEDEDIDINTGVVLTDVLNGDIDLVFGKAVMKQMMTRVFINDKTRYLRWNDRFALCFGAELRGGNTIWTTIGYFIGERPNNVTTESIVEFTAYDEMQMFDVLADGFSSTLTFPCTLGTIVQKLCLFVGLKNGTTPLCVLPSSSNVPIIGRQYEKFPLYEAGHTCREILSLIAEACGTYARIREGYLYLDWFKDYTGIYNLTITEDEQFSMEHADLYYGITWDEFDQYSLSEQEDMTWDEVQGYYTYTYGISCVRIRQTNLGFDVDYPQSSTPETRNVYLIVDNPFLQITNVSSDRDTYVKYLYDKLKAFGGRLPVNVECVGNWFTESGDIINVITGEDTIQMPIYCKTMTWKGSVTDTLETTGNKDREAVTSSNEGKILGNSLIRLFVEDNYYECKSGVDIDANGVSIYGSKTIDIESGSKINIKNGSDLDVKSGGTINIESGGNLNVSSGGNIDIRGEGTLALTGSTVQLTSGSTFDLDSNNLKITSNNGELEVTNGGLKVKKRINQNLDYNFYLGGITGNFWDSEVLKAALIANIKSSVVNNQTIYTYPVCLEITDKVYSPGTEYYTGILFGRTAFKKDLHLGPGSTPGKQILTGLYVEAVNRTTGSVINSAIESYYGIFDDINTNEIKSYKITTTYIYYTYMIQNSSREIKHNIHPLPSVGEKIDKLQPVTFVYDDDKDEKQRMGLIYEDTAEVMPEICTDDESNKGINYVELIPALLKEIQELRARVKALEERGIN